MTVLIGLLQVLTNAPVSAAVAAGPVVAESTTVGGLCWRARPEPRCGWFLITEFGMGHSSRDPYTPRADIGFGLMKNVGRRNAVGAALVFSGDESHNRIAFNPRYRRWLNSVLAFEVGAGPVSYCEKQGPEGCGGGPSQSGFQVETAFHLAGLVAVTATFEHLGTSGTASLPKQNRWYLGAKGSAYASPLVLLGLGILVGATWN
jgi:hypothetical protein